MKTRRRMGTMIMKRIMHLYVWRKINYYYQEYIIERGRVSYSSIVSETAVV